MVDLGKARAACRLAPCGDLPRRIRNNVKEYEQMSDDKHTRTTLPASRCRRSPLFALAIAVTLSLATAGWSGEAFAQSSSGPSGSSANSDSSNATGDAPGHSDPGVAGGAVSGMQTGTAGDLSGMMGEVGERVIVIDVRKRADFARSHIPQAVNLEVRYSEVLRDHVIDSKSVFGPDKSARIVVYGYRANDPAAVAVVRKAAAEGYTNVIWMRGGFAEWVSARLPMAKGRDLAASASM
jgi:rhodanese-related sulfurtransferase